MALQVEDGKSQSGNVTQLPETDSLKATRMATLLGIEAAAREAASLVDLAMRFVNEPRSLTGFNQAFCLEKTGAMSFRTIAVTSQAQVNRHAPHIQMIEQCAAAIAREYNADDAFAFTLKDMKTAWPEEQAAYPYPYFYWLPVIASGETDKPKQLGGYLIARQSPWRDVDIIVLRRIVETYAHAWHTLELAKKLKPRKKYSIRLLGSVSILLFAVLMMVPVPYTAIAPAQVIAADPWVVSAPIDGVLEDIYVNPNDTIEKGDVLFSFVDTVLRNNAEIAKNELLLAETRAVNVKRNALVDAQGRREIAVMNAEQALAATQKKYAQELLDNVTVTAPRGGIVLSPNKTDLSGKPVAVGEKIMEIADPSHVEVAIEVATGDGLILNVGQAVTVYLDVDPLTPIRGEIIRANFIPETTNTGTIAYRGIVAIDQKNSPLPRIGLRGSAKIISGKRALGYWLFRRPIVSLRRMFGV